VSPMRSFTLHQIRGSFGIVQLSADSSVPHWALDPCPFSAVVRTEHELTIVFPLDRLPADLRGGRSWACLRVEGPFDFSEIGVLASLAAPLAEASVSIFAVSTYDTDYLLVQGSQLTAARSALEATGHRVELL
jgi:uncharacterized protein